MLTCFRVLFDTPSLPGTSLASVIPAIGNRTSSTGVQGEHGNTASAGVSGPEQVLPVRNVAVATVPLRSGLGLSLSQPPSDSLSLSSIVNEINSQLRQLSGNMQEGNQPASGSQLLHGQMVKNQRCIVLFTY